LPQRLQESCQMFKAHAELHLAGHQFRNKPIGRLRLNRCSTGGRRGACMARIES
jgi:hypothetical protein